MQLAKKWFTNAKANNKNIAHYMNETAGPTDRFTTPYALLNE